MHSIVFINYSHHTFVSPVSPDKTLLHSWTAACHAQQHFSRPLTKRREKNRVVLRCWCLSHLDSKHAVSTRLYGETLTSHSSMCGNDFANVSSPYGWSTGSCCLVSTYAVLSKHRLTDGCVVLQSAGSYGITSNLYTVLVGLSGASWPLMGYDSVAHMMEETKSADTTAGKPMPYTLVASFVIGLVYLLALTLCIQVSSWCCILSHMLCLE